MARSLGTLTIDLILKFAGFKEGLDKAGRELDKTEKQLAAMGREGKRLEESLRTPFEKMQAELTRYNELLAKGSITQETFDRAVRKSATAFDALNPDLQQHNKLLEQGRALTQSLRTPQEQLTASLAKYDALLKAGAIDQQTFNRAVAQAQGNYKTATTGASQFGTAVGKARGVLLGLGVPLSLAAIAQGFKAATVEAVQFGEDLGKAMAKTGLGAEAMSELAAVAKQSEVDLGTLSVALRNMQITISDAVNPTSAAAKTLKELGLTIKDLEGLDADKRFELIAQRILEFGDEADRAALRLDVFKRAGDAIAPVTEKGARGIRDMRDAMRELGGTTSGETQAALEEAAQAADDLATAYFGLKLSMAGVIAPGLSDFLRGVTDVITGQGDEVLTLGDRWTAFWKGLQAGPFAGGVVALRELGKAAREARAELGEIEITATPIGMRKRTPPPDTKGASEAERARKSILDLITTMEQQAVVTGETEEATIRYRIAYGDLVDDFEKAGPAFDKRKQQLIDAAIAMDQFKASEELDKANEQIAQQVIELQAARIAQTEGAAAAYAYLAAHGELAKTLNLATDSQEEYNAALKRGQDAAASLEFEQAVTSIQNLVTATTDATSAIIATAIAEEQGAAAAIRYRIAHGDLKQMFEDLGPAAAEWQKKLEDAAAAQEVLTQKQAEDAASESIIPSRVKALKEYDDAIAGLNRRLAEGEISQRDFDQAIKIAEKNFKEGTKAIDEMSVFAEEAARNMQDAFADFLFDPLEDGFEGMVTGFADTLRRMSAEAVAAKIFEKFNVADIFKTGGLGGIFGGGGAGVPAGATPGINPYTPYPVIGATGGAAGAAGTAAATTAATTFATAISTAGTAAAAALTASGTTVAAAITTAGTAAAAAIAAAATAGGAASALGGLKSASGGDLGWLFTDIFGMAKGGPVIGPGTGTSDSIPARLSAGEFVVKAEAVRVPGVQALLERINDGSVFRGFAAGGLVRPPPPAPPLPQYLAAGGLVERVAGPTGGREPTVINQQFAFPGFTGQMSRQTEMQITAAAARGARAADRHNN